MKASKKPPRLTDYADNLQGRLRVIAARYSQSEIARRTGNWVSNINHYLNGTRIPAEFCSALVDQFGVNPSWLLTGEGAPWLDDVNADTSAMASDLLELVQSMGAVSKMKLGALMGNEHAKVLRELNDALRRHDQISAKLSARGANVLNSLLDEMKEATQHNELDRADHAKSAAAQVLRICPDPELAERFHSLAAALARAHGDAVLALEMHGNVFRSALAMHSSDEPGFCIPAFNYAMSLNAAGLFREGIRVCEAVLALARGAAKTAEGHCLVRVTRGWQDVQLGAINMGMATIAGALAELQHDEAKNHGAAPPYLYAQLLSGLLSLSDAMTYGADTPGKDVVLLQFACLTEDAPGLKAALGRCKGEPDVSIWSNHWQAKRAAILHKALESRDESVLHELQKLPARETAGADDAYTQQAIAVFACQVARIVGAKARARQLLQAAEERWAELPDECLPHLTTRAVHFRNAVELIPRNSRSSRLADLRSRARAFFEEHLRNGYLSFRALSSA